MRGIRAVKHSSGQQSRHPDSTHCDRRSMIRRARPLPGRAVWQFRPLPHTNLLPSVAIPAPPNRVSAAASRSFTRCFAERRCRVARGGSPATGSPIADEGVVVVEVPEEGPFGEAMKRGHESFALTGTAEDAKRRPWVLIS